MEVLVKYFGIIADITQKKEEAFRSEGSIETIKSLQLHLEKLYPEIKTTTYSLALNQKLTQENPTLSNRDEVALLPPFAGG